jgi:hypothetical protein
MNKCTGAWLFVALQWAVACTFLVDDHPDRLRCMPAMDGGADPCPQGFVCGGGLCVPAACADLPEKCFDGIDNDCDGKTDEAASSADLCGDLLDNDCDGRTDEGHDNDNDGNTWCGDLSGDTRTGDCDEFNSAVHYGATEICDGYDNDCNGKVDDAPSNGSLCGVGEECVGRCVRPSCVNPTSSAACGPDERCDADTGQCVAQTCGAVTCPLGQYCDRSSNTCRSLSRIIGQPCAVDVDCQSGSCVDSAALGLITESVRVCGQACCTDQDCGSDNACFAPGTGARSCLPKGLLSQSVQSVVPCSAQSECTGGTECVAAPQSRLSVLTGKREQHVTTACDKPGASAAYAGAFCVNASDCGTHMCTRSSVFGVAGECSIPCGTSHDCAALEQRPLFPLAVQAAYCRTLRIQLDDAHTGFIPTCVLDRTSPGLGRLGDTCSAGEDCGDGVCAATPRGSRCAPACCRDADCQTNGVRGRCRPLTFGDHYEMRCVL